MHHFLGKDLWRLQQEYPSGKPDQCISSCLPNFKKGNTVQRLSKLILLGSVLTGSMGWGFFAHQKINRLAVFILPPEMIGFYKKNIQYITETAVNPDRRRYAVPKEGPRHFIDLDDYGDSAAHKLPRFWNEAVKKL